MTESLDPTDWAILVEVQRDGRILVDEMTQFGSTTTNLVYSQTQPYRDQQGPPADL